MIFELCFHLHNWSLLVFQVETVCSTNVVILYFLIIFESNFADFIKAFSKSLSVTVWAVKLRFFHYLLHWHVVESIGSLWWCYCRNSILNSTTLCHLILEWVVLVQIVMGEISFFEATINAVFNTLTQFFGNYCALGTACLISIDIYWHFRKELLWRFFYCFLCSRCCCLLLSRYNLSTFLYLINNFVFKVLWKANR